MPAGSVCRLSRVGRLRRQRSIPGPYRSPARVYRCRRRGHGHSPLLGWTTQLRQHDLFALAGPAGVPSPTAVASRARGLEHAAARARSDARNAAGTGAGDHDPSRILFRAAAGGPSGAVTRVTSGSRCPSAHCTSRRRVRWCFFCSLQRAAAAILTGDCNFCPEALERTRLCAPIDEATPPYCDAWEIVHPGQPHVPTVGLYDKVQWPGPPFTFDFVFVSEDLAPRVRDLQVDCASDASDHQPVLLELG
ncbi:endonuclease/exonuclease/phosphatase family protein [Undibacterium arcticum]